MGWAEQMFDDAFKQAEAIHAFVNSPVGQALVIIRRGGDDAADVFISQHETVMDYARQIRELKAKVAELEAACQKTA